MSLTSNTAPMFGTNKENDDLLYSKHAKTPLTTTKTSLSNITSTPTATTTLTSTMSTGKTVRRNKRSSLTHIISTLQSLFKPIHSREAKFFTDLVKTEHRKPATWNRVLCFLFYHYAKPTPEYNDHSLHENRHELQKIFQIAIQHVRKQIATPGATSQQQQQDEDITKTLTLQNIYLMLLICIRNGRESSSFLVSADFIKQELRNLYFSKILDGMSLFYVIYAIFCLHCAGDKAKAIAYIDLARQRGVKPDGVLISAQTALESGKFEDLDAAVVSFFEPVETVSMTSEAVSPPTISTTIPSSNVFTAPRSPVSSRFATPRSPASRKSYEYDDDEAMRSMLKKRKRLSNDPMSNTSRKVSKTSYGNTPLRSSQFLEPPDVHRSSLLEVPIVIRDDLLSAPQVTPSRSSKSMSNQQAMIAPAQTASSSTYVQQPQQQVTYFTVNNNQYKMIDMIGKGGSSKVYRVFSPDQKILALKIVELRNHDKTTLQGFINEVQLLNKLRGKPNIIELKDFEVQKDYLMIVMECGDLDLNTVMRLQKGRALNPNQIRLYCQQMLEALNTIHENRIVHSDLKPANFLMVKGSLKLIDFGIAKQIKNDTTNIVRDSQIGTVNYIPPEALLFNQSATQNAQKPRYKLGRSSDLWSFGCIVYQMVYGKPPFADLEIIQKIHAITNPNYQIHYPSLPDGMDTHVLELLKATLVRNPEQRATIPQLLESEFLKPHRVGTATIQKDKASNVLASLIGSLNSAGKTLEPDQVKILAKNALDMIIDNKTSAEHIVKYVVEGLDQPSKIQQ